MDLMTHDVEGSKTFYGELFGWDFTDQGEDFGHYHLISKDGKLVGGLMSTLMNQDGPTDEPTAPTAWNVYLHSADVAGAIEKLQAAGASLVFGPMDVADHGRQAFVVDPSGAALGLWQPNQMAGSSCR
jgi:predicted enzyme related to lactoylglutathione lyase